jgi:hypothetical protein
MREYDALGLLTREIAKIKKAVNELVEAIHKYQQSEESQKEQQTKTLLNSISDSKFRLPVEITEYYDSEQRERPEKQDWEEFKTCLEIAGVIVAVALLYLTFRTLNVFYGQLREMKKQTATLSRQATQAAEDAQTQINKIGEQVTAARQANKLTRESMELQARPWLTIEGPFTNIQTARLHDRPTSMTISFDWKIRNYGTSVATLSRPQFTIIEGGCQKAGCFRQFDQCPEADEYLRGEETQFVNAVFPGADGVISRNDAVQSAQSDAPLVRSPFNYLIGCIAYRGGVTQTIYHTRFVYQLDYSPNLTTMGSIRYFPVAGLKRIFIWACCPWSKNCND